MKQIKGVVQLHGDHVIVGTGNNEQYAIIDGVSTYDFEGVIMNQTTSWKLDLIKDICSELKIKDLKKLSDMVEGLYSKEDLENTWKASSLHTNEVERISSGRSNFSVPMSDDKVRHFKDKK
jgi:endo-1,4-beta-mannosidase